MRYQTPPAALPSTPSVRHTVPPFSNAIPSFTQTSPPVSRALASLKVQVPENAIVYIGSMRTTSVGKERQYVYQKLQPGQAVTYQVRAEIVVNGHKVHETKQVDLHAGGESRLVFDFSDVETSLTLSVPPDAKVFLADSAKKGSGTVRVFKSKKLAVGQKVSDYPVRVSVIRHGQLISKEERISLAFGESKTLSFRFDEQSPIAAVP